MKQPKLKVLGNRLVVRRIEKATTNKIVIPDEYKEPSAYGEVVAVGTGQRSKYGQFVPFDVKVGDIVMFGTRAGMDLVVEGQTFRLLNYSDLYLRE